MDSSAASAYAYAKASGLLAKSFVGDRVYRLFSVKSMRELYMLLFAGDVPAVPEILLSKEIEVRAAENCVAQYKKLLSAFSRPSPILSEILKFYEYENSAETNDDTDRAMIRSLWNDIQRLPSADRKNLEKLYRVEFSFKNILWVLRLKLYYHFSDEQILAHLVFCNPSDGRTDVLAGEAVSIIGKDVNSYDDWKDWKYARFLNPHEDGVMWEIDPCWIERSVKNELVRAYQHFFHRDPMSVTSLVAWFRIKQNELDCIRTITEGLRLEVGADAVFEAAGVSAPAAGNRG